MHVGRHAYATLISSYQVHATASVPEAEKVASRALSLILSTDVLKMSESKAAEDYKAFESLRNRFKDESGSSSSPSRPEPRKSGKRRFDPRANAPPLVPLIEEGDILQGVKVSITASKRGEGLGANAK